MKNKYPDFKSQVVIVTGASSGIGRALALRLAGQGACVALAARDQARLESLAEECRRRGGEALPLPTDVTEEAQCRQLVDRTVEAYGRLDMLVNNAGIAVTGLLEELPDLTLFKYVVDVNFYGVVYCTYYALRHLKASQGRLVNITSLGGRLALPYNSPYNASKFAVHGFSDSLRIELAGSGTSVTVVCPYWVATEFHERYMDKDGHPRGPQGRAVYTDKTMTADRCAAIVLEAAWKRKREVLMGPGNLGVWLKLIAPGFLDWFTVESVLKPAIRRARQGRES